MTIILILLALIYVLRYLIMLYGSLKEKHLNKIAFSTAKDFRGFVSVIVPARNEENNIENAIRSIAASNFPTDQFEIIAVNDRSNDGTGDILNKLSDQIPNLKVIHLTEYSKSKNIPGKPGAIDVGIKASRGELIMMTDADCTVNPDWIKTVSLYFTDKDVALVPSFTLIKSKSLFDKIQSLEWLYLHTFASGAIGLNTPMGCYGNNLAVRRSVYDEIGGYEKIKFSVTEDLALLQTIHKTGYKVHYITDFHTSVTTLPVTSFGEYVSQHRRWALGGLSLGWIAAVFVLTTMSMWAGFFISLFIGEIALAFGFIILRVIADFLTYLPAAIELKESRNLIYSPIALPFFIFFELIIPFLMINKTITWKGQKFSKNS